MVETMSVIAAQQERLRDLRELILHENHPWQERLLLIEEYHDIRVKENGSRKVGRPIKNAAPLWSLRDTARELKIGVGPLSEYLRLIRDWKLHNEEYESCTLRTAVIKFRTKSK